VDTLFAGYAARERTFDEMFEAAPNEVRSGYTDVHNRLTRMSPADVRGRADFLARIYVEQGVTFDIGGEERPFPLDIVPRLLDADTWATVEVGLTQRVRALERFLDDVYGPGDLFNDEVMPRTVVTSSPHFHRVVAGLTPANGVRVHVSGIDLVRDGDGRFRVLEDNVRIPSGVSYVMTNRRALTSALPEVFADHRIRPVRSYPARLLAALRASAPSGVSDPTVVVLTPGVYNSAYFEHALLARMMGCRLVEGRDLVCQAGRVMVRTTTGLRPVHVIYRRVDDEFLDPVHFRGDSLLGCAGLVNAARAGNVTLANALGNGVADDKLVYTYVPDLIRYYLGEEPVLPNVDTWRLEDPAHRAEVLDRLAELVLKPVDGSGGKGIVIGPAASTAQLDAVRARNPGQPPRVDRPARRATLDGADARRRAVGASPRRPASLRGQRRVVRVGAARRADPRRSRRGPAHRQLQPGRRFQGHLGAGQPRGRRRRADPGTPRPSGGGVIGRASAGPQRRHPALRTLPGRATATATATARSPGGPVLSRIAESLYWIGRYLERAEDTSRLLDVQLHLSVEDPVIDARASADRLLTVMGIDHEGPATEDLVLRRLCHDPDSPASIVSALKGARESARRSRETVSTEMWEAINTTWYAVQRGELAKVRPALAFRWVRERCAVITATADGTMSHDQGWYFLVLGRSLERIDMTARLAASAATGPAATAWSSTLRACGAHHAFVRGHHDQDSDSEAAEFLLLDRLFPRSIVHTLDTAMDALDRLTPPERRGLTEDEVARTLGRARAELEYRTRGEVLLDLPERMAELQITCARANAAISARYFEGAVAAEWRGGAQ
jgi:uncharacterized circularly permuted ATP-grasp superfamily protein/uncharacterized alpha-E superfamily protein